MPLERAEMSIKEGQEAEFAVVMRDKAVPLLAGLPGVTSVKFGRGVENPDKFLLLVDWATMADHTAFIQMPIFGDFRAMLMPYSKGGGMEHFEMG